MFQLSDEAIKPETLRAATLDPSAGGFSSFEGWVRNHHLGKPVRSLEYSAYPELAIKEGQRIIQAAINKYDIISAHCQHRVGHLHIGDIAIAIAVSAAHRDAAFQACRFIIDEIKKSVPIWKKEHYLDNSSAWPECQGCHSPATSQTN